jgi:hypothetical protein
MWLMTDAQTHVVRYFAAVVSRLSNENASNFAEIISDLPARGKLSL